MMLARCSLLRRQLLFRLQLGVFFTVERLGPAKEDKGSSSLLVSVFSPPVYYHRNPNIKAYGGGQPSFPHLFVVSLKRFCGVLSRLMPSLPAFCSKEKKKTTTTTKKQHIYVVAQFYPCFKILFPFFSNSSLYITIHYYTQTQRKTKCELRIKLHHNIDISY